MARENPLWSRRRIASELAKLGHSVDKDTVAKYMPRPTRPPRRPPSQTWKTFLRNHLAGTIAIDFLTVPTVTFNIVYVFFVLSLERRRVPDSPKARRQLAFVGIEHATCERRVFHPLRQRKAYIVECIHHVHA
jgi:hypothetical protein